MKKIFFPTLHLELIDRKKLQGITLINPGIANIEDPNSLFYYCPKKFPLNAKEAEGYVRDFLSYGEFFRDPKEIRHHFIMHIFDRDSEKPSTLKSLIKKGQRDKEDIDYFLVAQLVLLLLWSMEERLIEFQKLDLELQESLKKLEQSIGEDVTLDLFGKGSYNNNFFFPAMPLLSYEKLLPWFFLILDKEHILITNVSELYEGWVDFGIEFFLVEPNRNIYQANDYGYRFIFKKKPLKKFSWLNKKYRVEFIKG